MTESQMATFDDACAMLESVFDGFSLLAVSIISKDSDEQATCAMVKREFGLQVAEPNEN